MHRSILALGAILIAVVAQPALAQMKIIEQDTCPGGAGAQKFGGPYVVRFDIDSTEVMAPHRSELELAAKTIEGQRPQLVCLIGSTDKTGSVEYNRKLALRRAHAVGQELIKLGVKADDSASALPEPLPA